MSEDEDNPFLNPENFDLEVKEIDPEEVEMTIHDPGSEPEMEEEPNEYWCECEYEGTWVFRDDGECDCGVHKHHYHCPECGGVTQVG